MIDRVLRIDKLAGPTSHDVVNRARRLLKQKRVGHAGTLDPLASGLLLVLAGQATKISAWLTDLDKVYRARLRLGIATDSGDRAGAPITEAPVPEDLAERLPVALERFTGELMQVPPMTSAIKVDGEPLYRWQRAGREVARAPRRIVVHEITCLELTPPELELRIRCGKGTYVRTLAADLATALGTCGHLIELRREAIGRIGLAGAVTSDELSTLDREAVFERAGMTLGEALAHLPAIVISQAAVAGVGEGRLPSPSELTAVTGPLAPGDLARLEAEGGELLAIVEARAALANGAEGESRSAAAALPAVPFRFRRVLARPEAALAGVSGADG
jgi:tRNA pseudouridine55 synthase